MTHIEIASIKTVNTRKALGIVDVARLNILEFKGVRCNAAMYPYSKTLNWRNPYAMNPIFIILAFFQCKTLR